MANQTPSSMLAEIVVDALKEPLVLMVDQAIKCTDDVPFDERHDAIRQHIQLATQFNEVEQYGRAVNMAWDTDKTLRDSILQVLTEPMRVQVDRAISRAMVIMDIRLRKPITRTLECLARPIWVEDVGVGCYLRLKPSVWKRENLDVEEYRRHGQGSNTRFKVLDIRDNEEDSAMEFRFCVITPAHKNNQITKSIWVPWYACMGPSLDFPLNFK